jgi:hypothetical protein
VECEKSGQGSFITAGKEASENRFDLVGVRVRWDIGGAEATKECTFSLENGSGNHEVGTHFFCAE